MPSNICNIYLFSIFAAIASFIPLSFVNQGSGGGSLFDLLLPLFLPFFIFKYRNILTPRTSTSFALLALVFAFISVFSKINLLQPIIAVGIFARILFVIFYLCFVVYFVPPLANQKNISKFTYKAILSTSLFYIVTCILSFVSFLLGSWRIGFPLYSNGFDPHVWGPSVTMSGLLLLNSLFAFIKLQNIYPFKSNYFEPRALLFVASITCILMGLLSGSRGALLSLFVMTLLIFPFFYKSFYRSIYLFFVRCIVPAFLSLVIFSSLLLPLGFTKMLPSSTAFSNIEFYLARTIDVSGIIEGSDASRSDKLKSIFNYMIESNPISLLFGEDKLVYKNDSGLLFYIQNFGYLSAILLSISILLIWLGPSFHDTPLISFLFAVLFITVIGSESVFVPRFLLFPLPALLLAKSLRFQKQ